VIAMSAAEISRYETLQRVERREITGSEAGDLFRLCRRQVYRLLDSFRAEGAARLASRKREFSRVVERAAEAGNDDFIRCRLHLIRSKTLIASIG
jgi:hypothetical protein